MKQDQAEAKSTVDTRLEFIRGEMCVEISDNSVLLMNNGTSKRIETQLKDIEAKSEKKKAEVCRRFYAPQRVVHQSLHHRLSRYKQQFNSKANPLRKILNYLVDKSNATSPKIILDIMMRVFQDLEIH